jgi:hypothetical protein
VADLMADSEPGSAVVVGRRPINIFSNVKDPPERVHGTFTGAKFSLGKNIKVKAIHEVVQSELEERKHREARPLIAPRDPSNGVSEVFNHFH